jgi:hypothetical protein
LLLLPIFRVVLCADGCVYDMSVASARGVSLA